MVVIGDLNARVINEVIEGIVGWHGVPGRNDSHERLLEMCEEQEIVVVNSWFKKKIICINTAVENGGRKGGRQGIMDCVVTKTNMLGRLLDVKVWRREGGGMSEHFLVEARLKLLGSCMEEYREEGGCEKCVEGE